MSLKPKLEAVIYAAEEPVTLAQLAAIFADEVLPGLDETADLAPEQIALAGLSCCRVSVTGQPRAAVCGIGICFECRAEVDGIAHAKTCQILCRPGMAIRTDAS